MLLTFTWWPRRGRSRVASSTEPGWQLTDEQWLLIADLFPTPKPSPAGGRPRVPPRPCLEGVLWVLRTGARWRDLPKTFHSPATGWRRLKEWTASGAFQKAWARVLRRLDGLGRIDWEEAMADGTFAPAKTGGACVGKTQRGKGSKPMTLVDGPGVPQAIDVASASPAEVTLIEPLLQVRVLRRKPRRLISDLAADSDPLRERLARRGIELVWGPGTLAEAHTSPLGGKASACHGPPRGTCVGTSRDGPGEAWPHRRNRTKPKTQDGRKLRRYRHRWKVERSIRWLFNFRRLVVRYEHHARLFLGFAQLACLFTTLRQF